jgi:hypothetical protein
MTEAGRKNPEGFDFCLLVKYNPVLIATAPFEKY